MSRRKKIGLALGGGFLRGTAHVGVLKVLEKANLKPDIVAGTSSGSIIASLYAAGKTPVEIEAIAKSLKPNQVYDNWSVILHLLEILKGKLCDFGPFNCYLQGPLGLMSGKKIEKFLNHHLQEKNFTQLKMKLAITAVDINSGTKVIFVRETRSLKKGMGEVYLSQGKVADAVRASTSVPGLFVPKKMFGYQLVDGGLRENVPVEVLKKLGADAILAVDVGGKDENYVLVDGLLSVLAQTIEIIHRNDIEGKLEQYADLVIAPQLQDIGPKDFQNIKEAIDVGEKAALEKLPEIMALFEK